MKSSDLFGAIKDGASKLDASVDNFGSVVADKCYENSRALIEWANYFYLSERTGSCDEFIDGFRASIVESIFCCSTGLVRLATFSMRAQIDIALSWIYFKDHPIEYDKVHQTSNGFILKSDSKKYFEGYYNNYSSKFDKLKSVMTRQAEDPYRLLSAHVHSQSLHTIPIATDFSSLVSGKDLSLEAAELQRNVSEYLEDVFLSCFGHKWVNLPVPIIDRAKGRLISDESIRVVLS